jgi:flagellar motor switch/type III secretory pathway protein FliN
LVNFSLPVKIEILSTSMPVGELHRLRVGALVPVGAPLESRDVLVSIGWRARVVAPAVINNKIVTLQGGVRPMDESQAGNVGVALSDLSKMENLEVQFTVELATCSLPLSELSRLGAGSTLNLGLPHEPPLVRLCVNGKAIATGELVVLGQSLGVQIVDMAPA